jgi:hypothetical protein
MQGVNGEDSSCDTWSEVRIEAQEESPEDAEPFRP